MHFYKNNFFDNTFYSECKKAVFSKFDFSMHPGISKLVSTQKLEFLGFAINSKQMTVYQKESPPRCSKWLPHLWSVHQV